MVRTLKHSLRNPGIYCLPKSLLTYPRKEKTVYIRFNFMGKTHNFLGERWEGGKKGWSSRTKKNMSKKTEENKKDR